MSYFVFVFRFVSATRPVFRVVFVLKIQLVSEYNQTAPEVAEVRKTGADLTQMVEKLERPEVRKQ